MIGGHAARILTGMEEEKTGGSEGNGVVRIETVRKGRLGRRVWGFSAGYARRRF
jgi:hypothetical protein